MRVCDEDVIMTQRYLTVTGIGLGSRAGLLCCPCFCYRKGSMVISR